MIALKISLNGKHKVTAGTEDLGVLSANMDARGILGNDSAGVNNQREEGRTSGYILELAVKGLTSRGTADEHLGWIDYDKLNIGDEIQIEVIDTTKADEPISRKPKRS